ncbi:MAG: type II secretion system secretin GspD [Bdellovibrionota bacterium]
MNRPFTSVRRASLSAIVLAALLGQPFAAAQPADPAATPKPAQTPLERILQGSPPKPAPAKPVTKKKAAPKEELFEINFSNLALEDLVKTYAKWMGKNFLLTDKLKSATITIYSERKVTKGEAWRVFEAILRANGYTIVPGDEVNRIIPTTEAVSDLVPTYSTDGLVYGTRSFSYVTRLFPLQHVSATEIKGVISKFVSKGADVMDYPPTNLLIITESSVHINRVIQILKELDVPPTDELIEILDVKYSSAEDMASMIENILSGGGGRRRGAAPAAPAQGAQAPGGGTARIIPDERTNSLIVVGTKKQIEAVKKLLTMLDIDVEGGGSEVGIFVYYVQYAKAEDLASTLNSLIGGAQAQQKSATGSQKASGSSLQQRSSQREKQTIQQAQQAGGQAPAGGSAAQTLSGAQFESDIRISSDKATNSLIITSTRRDYETLKRVIEKLDVPRRQVFVEAAILEVLANDSLNLGFSLFGATSYGDGGVVFGQQNFGTPPSPAAATAATSGSTSAATALTALSGISAGVIGPTEGIDMDGDGDDDLTVPTYGAIMQAAKSDRNSNVLSTPTVLTSDNEQAQIIVANNVPIPTGQTVGTSGVTTSTITREDIGITLRITPQINQGDSLNLEIFVEISNVAPGSFGIDVNSSGIVTTVRSAETIVTVRDRQPVVIGGLIQESDGISETKVPVLGDIPLLGALFRSRQSIKDKTNLIIILTPNIVRDHQDSSRVMALEVEQRKPILENEVLRKWLEAKNLESTQAAYRTEPAEDRLPLVLEPGQVLITPQGAYTHETYAPLPPPKPETEAEEGKDGPVGTLEGVKKKGAEDLPATGTPSAPAATDGAASPPAGAPSYPPATQPPDPEAIRKQILEEREKRQKEREERNRSGTNP